jgi:2-oxoglutarate ferredoxin oxidoreductase subunit gamma
METKILISGFGGQGMISLGKILAKAALYDDYYVIGFPSYGAEMRGGTAHCFIKISDSTIASPFIDFPDVAIILNQPSLDKFKSKLKKGCIAILNRDLINNESLNRNIKKISLPLNKLALDCGHVRVANIIALGVLTSVLPDFLKEASVLRALKEAFSTESNWKRNLKAFKKGQAIASKESVLC